MSDNDDSKQFFPDDEIARDRIIVEVPINPKSPYEERVPSGYDPMSEIYLRGRAFRGLAGGRIRWWVLISGWIFFWKFSFVDSDFSNYLSRVWGVASFGFCYHSYYNSLERNDC